ncbi:YopX family protein, partial [Leuconostoc sp.]
MREIKFRVWDNEENNFWGEGRSLSLVSLVSDSLVNDDSTVLEQYTGLKDFNGAEIYEGDILQDVDDSTIVGVVEYDKAFGEYDCGDNNLYECTRDCVVIGNIHENADLLNDTER